MNELILHKLCNVGFRVYAEKSSGQIYILMEARLCELYKSAADYEIIERSLMFDVNQILNLVRFCEEDFVLYHLIFRYLDV